MTAGSGEPASLRNRFWKFFDDIKQVLGLSSSRSRIGPQSLGMAQTVS
jgi:hypothetical protein